MARTSSTTTPALPRVLYAQIESTANGFLVRIQKRCPERAAATEILQRSRAILVGTEPVEYEVHTFESFASMTKFLSKTLVNGG